MFVVMVQASRVLATAVCFFKDETKLGASRHCSPKGHRFAKGFRFCWVRPFVIWFPVQFVIWFPVQLLIVASCSVPPQTTTAFFG